MFYLAILGIILFSLLILPTLLPTKVAERIFRMFGGGKGE